MTYSPARLSVAPMMDWTDRHFRYFIRRFTSCTQLYTEMVTAQAVIFGDAEKLLGFHPDENPIILQLGGSSPDMLGQACHIAQSFPYDGINLNAGCPSERVAAGNFGASLRQDPQLIADCLQAMRENSKVPVSVKTRIALEEMTQNTDGYDDLCCFAEIASKVGVNEFTIHARKAKLKGFSPKQNRERPQIRYDLVYRFKQDFPHLFVSINGNINSLESAKEHLKHVDGVMMGRSIYADPYLLSEADNEILGASLPIISRVEAVKKMQPYIENMLAQGVRLNSITRHMLNLFKGCPGAAMWRRILTERSVLPNADFKVVAEALNNVISSD